MNAKDKAKELFDRYLSIIGVNCPHDSYCKNPQCIYEKKIVCFVEFKTAKKCSLFAVDEILKTYDTKDLIYPKEVKYWQQVKTEIEKL
jgi:hypothetical protein